MGDPKEKQPKNSKSQPPANEGDTPKKRLVARATFEASFSGPMPPPHILEQYDKIVPGAAERIISLAEKQSDHRRGLENRVINSDIQNSRLGLIFAFVIGVIGVGGGIFAAILGNQGIGTLISVLSLGSLVTTFIYGSKSRKDERSERKSIGIKKEPPA